MKYIILVISLLSSLYSDITLAKDTSASKSDMKKSKIKPASANSGTWSHNADADDYGTWTFNTETDIYRLGTYQNIAGSYADPNGWSVSLSLLNTQILGANNLFQGDTFINVAKSFTISDTLSISIGSLNGVALTNIHPQVWYDYTYSDTQYNVTPSLMIHLGPYLANAALTGTTRQVGFLTGAEITFIPNKLALQMDYISGRQALSGATVNLLLNFTPSYQMYTGVYVPEQNSGYEFSGIVGFNYATAH